MKKKTTEMTREEAGRLTIADLEKRLEEMEDQKLRYKWMINMIRKMNLNQCRKYPSAERWYDNQAK